MSKFGWFVVGVGLGAFGLAQLRDNPKAQVAVDEIVAAAKEFSAAVADGYQEREEELKAPPKKRTPKS